jgi:hypothetical protein
VKGFEEVQIATTEAMETAAYDKISKYYHMLDSLNGSEGEGYPFAIFESIQHDEGYGQDAGHAAWRFGSKIFFKALLHELPRLIEDIPYWAGDFLVSIAKGQGTENEVFIHQFNRLLDECDYQSKLTINKWLCS